MSQIMLTASFQSQWHTNAILLCIKRFWVDHTLHVDQNETTEFGRLCSLPKRNWVSISQKSPEDRMAGHQRTKVFLNNNICSTVGRYAKVDRGANQSLEDLTL